MAKPAPMRSFDSRAKQLRYLIRTAISIVNKMPEARMAALGAPFGTDADTTRKDWLADAEKRPRAVITALAKEVKL